MRLPSASSTQFGITIRRGKIVGIDLVADPERIGQLDVVVLSE